MFEEQDDEDEDEDDVEEIEGNPDEDEEMLDVDEADSDVEAIEADDASSSADDDDDEDEEEDDEEEDSAEVADFEAKLAAALGTHRADKDLDADSSSDADMNDDEMEEIDAQLANVFRARRQVVSQHKDKKDARENMINFKNRVLDLLEIFVKKCHSKPLALDLILPLLRLARRSSVKQIAAKANAVLREYTKLCKGNAVPKIQAQGGDGDDSGEDGSDRSNVEPVWELLRVVHKEAGHSGPPAHATACSQASLLVVKVLVAADAGAVDGIVNVYAATRKEQLKSRKCHVQPSFFTDWNNWCVSASKQLKN